MYNKKDKLPPTWGKFWPHHQDSNRVGRRPYDVTNKPKLWLLWFQRNILFVLSLYIPYNPWRFAGLISEGWFEPWGFSLNTFWKSCDLLGRASFYNMGMIWCHIQNCTCKFCSFRGEDITNFLFFKLWWPKYATD